MLTIPRKAGPRAGRIASAKALGADAPALGEALRAETPEMAPGRRTIGGRNVRLLGEAPQ